MRRLRQFYGWFDPKESIKPKADQRPFRVSLYPPDSPVRPSLTFASKREAEIAMEKKRGTILWWPTLHPDQLKTEGRLPIL